MKTGSWDSVPEDNLDVESEPNLAKVEEKVKRKTLKDSKFG